MPAVTLEYRLRVRNQANSANLLILSSRSTDANCLLTEEPTGDGQRVDIFEGRSEVGAYTWRAVDREDGVDDRTVTALLADVDARNQMLSNVCVGEYSRNAGAWTAFHTGYLNAIRLPDALVYEFTVGDTDRREQDAELFRVATTAFDRVCCIIGGPVTATTPVAWGGTPTRAWGPVIDYGYARFEVIANPSGLVNPANRITLSLISGVFPPLYSGLQTSFVIPLGLGSLKISIAAEEIDRLARPYFEWDADGAYATDGSQDAQPWGSFPGLVVRLKAVSGGAVTLSYPIAQETTKRSALVLPPGGPDYPLGDYSALVANSNKRLIVAWPFIVTAPSVGALFDVLVYPSAISEQNPLHLRGHPIDLHTAANVQEGIPYDTASAASTKTALGDLFYELRIKSPQKYTEFVQMLKGSAGYATRYGPDGEQEFFATRVATPATVDTVTAAEIVTDE